MMRVSRKIRRKQARREECAQNQCNVIHGKPKLVSSDDPVDEEVPEKVKCCVMARSTEDMYMQTIWREAHLEAKIASNTAIHGTSKPTSSISATRGS